MSEERLEQPEIDALLRAVRANEIDLGPDSLARLRLIQRADLSDPNWGSDRIVRRPLPVLDSIFDRLGPALQISLTKSLRFPVRTETKPVTLSSFGDFRRNYSGIPCLFEIVRLDPLRGSTMIVLEQTVVYALIDALMGGLGVGELPDDRDVSEIEVMLLFKVVNEMLRDLENAWKPWFPLEVEHLRTDRAVNVMSTVPDAEICHIASIDVSGDVLPRTPIHFVMPYQAMEPLFEATSSRMGEETDPMWRSNLEAHVRELDTPVSAVLGTTSLQGSRIRALAEGDVIELDRKIDEPIDILVAGEPLFRGRLGRSNTQYGVRITEKREVERELVDRTVGQVLVRKGLISHEQLQVARVDEILNRRMLVDSLVARGWVDRKIAENALG